MPQHLHIKSDHSELIVWKIDEPINFFISQMQNWNSTLDSIKNETRKLQFAASRYVAGIIINSNDASQFQNAEDRRPFIENSELNISISHDQNWVAVLIGKHAVGIDIFCPTEKVLKISHKFLHPDEIRILLPNAGSDEEKTLIFSKVWCIKETVFKWMGIDGVEFKDDMKILSLEANSSTVHTSFKGELTVNFHSENDFYLSWVD